MYAMLQELRMPFACDFDDECHMQIATLVDKDVAPCIKYVNAIGIQNRTNILLRPYQRMKFIIPCCGIEMAMPS